jgi:hypothetical protein
MRIVKVSKIIVPHSYTFFNQVCLKKNKRNPEGETSISSNSNLIKVNEKGESRSY